MFQFKCGTRRLVIVVNWVYVIKIPKFWRFRSLIFGLIEQTLERWWWCPDGTQQWNDDYPLAKIHWASRRGWIIVAKYYRPLSDYPDQGKSMEEKILKEIEWHREYSYWPDISGEDGVDDIKYTPRNLGYDRENDRIVVIDYGSNGIGNIDMMQPVLCRKGKLTLNGKFRNWLVDRDNRKFKK